MCIRDSHKEVLESDARFLASIFEKNLEDIYMQSLDSDLLNQDAELNLSNIWEIVPLLNQSALVSLNIPHIQGIQAYDQNHRVLDLSTAINRSHPTGKDFVDAHSQGWSSRVISPTSLALLVPVTHDEELHFIEFSLLREPFENSWSEIDNTLVKQGLILALAMMAILWVIFRLMIRKISSKEKLLIEKTEVLQKTNEELSRAYKTTSLGAMTGHLMHGLKGQLTNLQNLVTEDKNIQEQIRKIQQLVQQSLGSIKETDHGEISYNLTVGQLLEIAQKKFTQLARETNFKIVHSDCLNESINNLQANLALAILTNLFQNSADARSGVSITLTLSLIHI